MRKSNYRYVVKCTDLNILIKTYFKANGIELTPEFRFDKNRRWRFDYAIPEKKIAIEIEGGIFISGRHTNPIGYSNDCEKYNTASMLGWQVFRFTSLMNEKGVLMKHLEIIKELTNNGKHSYSTRSSDIRVKESKKRKIKNKLKKTSMDSIQIALQSFNTLLQNII